MHEHRQFLLMAIELAFESVARHNGGPFGAVVVKNGEVVGRGSNQVTHHNDPTAHAEVVAIRDACRTLGTFQLEDCIIYSSCEPCPMCLGAIYWARPKALYYGADRGDAARAGFDDSYIYEQIELTGDQRDIPALKLEADEAVQVFEAWMRREDKKAY